MPEAGTVQREIVRRYEMERGLQADPALQAAVLRHYANSFQDWAADMLWTFDPRLLPPIPRRLPMLFWTRQRELADWLQERVDTSTNGLVKKARDMGVSWICVAYATWLWLFHSDSIITFGSRKEVYVDRLGDPKSLLEKVRAILRMLPLWMLPPGWEESSHSNFMHIQNPSNGSLIVGETGDDMGRGGRSLIYFLDEFAFVKRAEAVDAAVNDNAATVIYVSTSGGVGTLFYRKEMEGKIPVFHMYWRDHPDKDDAWKEAKLDEMGSVAFAREHEGDDASALEGIMIPASWVSAAVGLELDTTGTSWRAGLDVADQGEDSNAFVARHGPMVQLPVTWDQTLTAQTARRAFALGRERGLDLLVYDRLGPGGAVASAAADTPSLGFKLLPFGAGGTPTKTYYDDDPRVRADKRFANLGSEAWWRMRRAFEKTFEHVEGIRQYPHSELISLPREAGRLISQLSSRKVEYTESGKIRAEPKKRMRARGVQSPDEADALAMSLMDPPRRIRIPKRRGRVYGRNT